MKKAIFILVVFFLFSMVACGSNEGISIEPNDTLGAGPYVNYDYRDKDANWEELRKIAPRSDDFENYEEYKAYMEQNYPT